MKLIIGGDICPTESNMMFFKDGNAEKIVGKEILKELQKSDFRIANLECPLTDNADPIDKCGPNLISPQQAVKGIKALGIDFLTLANNHVLDQGEQGLFATVDTLEKEGILYGGVGKNLEEASKGFFLEKDGIKAGVYCCAEHEFSIAGEKSPGANPFDPLYSLDHISDMKMKCDYLIVLYHGGKEYYRYPTPGLQRSLRRVIEKGADLVVCQHSHCIGCEENYKEGKIIYGQGNFVFDHGDDEFWNSGMLIRLDIDGKGIKYLEPIVFVKEGNHIQEADAANKKRILDDYYERSAYVGDTDYILERWSEFSREKIPGYLRTLSGHFGNNIIIRGLSFLTGRKLGGLIIKRYSKREILAIYNRIECECHHELVKQGLMDMLKR